MVTDTSKGMYLDGSPMVNPKGTYRFALNTVNIGDEGELGYVSNEKGTTVSYSLDRKQIGHVNTINNEAVIISLQGNWFEIGVQKGDEYTPYIISKDFTEKLFSKTKQVRGEYRLVNGCNRIIYLCTPLLLSINLDSLDTYLKDGFTQATANSTGDGWDLTKFKLAPDYDYPYFSDTTVNNSGGSLVAGTYHATISYVDSNSNEVGWGDITNTIPVTDDAYTSFNSVDGAPGVPTTKSITFSIDNLDTRYPYYKIGIVAKTEGATTAYVSDSRDTTLDSFTLRSLEDLSPTALNSITINSVILEAAEDITQYDNRLLIAGVSEPAYTPSLFQQKANTYKTSWKAHLRLNESTNSSSQAGHKGYQAYVDVRGYMKDEVYALGIIWVFKNGFQTEAFHIPGRLKNTGVIGILPSSSDPNTYHSRPLPIDGWDDTEYSVGSIDLPTEDAAHITDAGSFLERWQVYNTATLQSTASTTIPYEGDLAYWESEIAYPDDVDCNGDRIYPEGNIRHHKMPDATLLSNTNEDHVYGYYLSIEASDIEPPEEYAEEIAGFYIVRVKRDDVNSSVLDKGLMTRMLYASQEFNIETDEAGTTLSQQSCYFQPYPWNSEAYNTTAGGAGATEYTIAAKISNGSEALHGIHTPRGKLTDIGLPSTYFKAENKYITRRPTDVTTGEFSTYQMQFYGTPLYRYAWLTTGDPEDADYVPEFTNRVITKQAYIDADSYLNGFFDHQVNNLEQQEVQIIQTESDVPDPASNIDMNGANYTEKATFYFGSLKQYIPSQYGNIEGLTYMKASDFIPYDGSPVVTNFFGGDTFISALYMRRQAKLAYKPNPGGIMYPINNAFDASGAWSQANWRILTKFYTESIVNCGLRNEGTENFEVYYPKSYSIDYSELRKFITLEGTLDLDGVIDGGGTLVKCDLIPNYYELNTDYLEEPNFKVYVGVRPFFDWCNACYNEFKRRIYYSNPATEEDTFDAYRVFLANNYKDLPSSKGSITSIFTQDDKIYTHTTDSMWLLNANYKTLEDQEGGTIKVGTGSFLGLPAIQIKSLKGGYLGVDYNQTIQTTETGVIFLSKNKIFQLGQGLQEISLRGMREFFETNSEVFFLEQFKTLTGLDYPNVNTSWGVGFISAYDREKNRYIISKRDYNILDNLTDNYKGVKSGGHSPEVGDIVWDDSTGILSTGGFLIYTDSGYTQLSLDNPEYFENKSFTLSFDITQNIWVSFHSYLPTYIYNTYYNLYSNKDEEVHKHNSGDYQNFYGVDYPHIVELVYPNNPLQSMVTRSISLTSHAREYSLNEKQWKDVVKTFDKVWLYNDTQSTGILDVTITNNDTGNPYLSLTYLDGSVLFYRADKTWHFKRFYNRYKNESKPIFDSSWEALQDEYFLDKVPTETEHEEADPFKQGKLRDKYIVARYILDNPENTKVTTLVSNSVDKPSIR